MVVFSFCLFLFLFIGVGMLSALAAKGNKADYLLAGSSVKPWLVALSAVATNNSGYMFIGMIGATYQYGISSVWIMIGWIFGDLIASLYIHRKLRDVTESQHVLSFGGILARWHGTEFRKLRFVCGIITVLFLATYAGAQFKAGSKALHVLFGWDYNTGAIIGAIMVFLYCMAGGIRASIWTDAAQSFVMIVAMVTLFVFGVDKVGGFSAFTQQLNAVSSTYMSLEPADIVVPGAPGMLLFLIGWFFAGFGVVGQPHIMIRFMTMDNSKNMNKVRLYYYSWFTAFYAVTIGVALVSKLIITASENFDSELALPMLANELLPSFLVGLVLAGLFAATMSTADSQILSCSSAITRDILPKEKTTYFMTKLATVFVTVLGLIIALYGPESVFALVIISWSLLAAAFGPILFVYSLGIRLKESVTIAMLVGGVAVTIAWRQLGLDVTIMNETGPGMLSGILVYLAAKFTGLNRVDAAYIEATKRAQVHPE